MSLKNSYASKKFKDSELRRSERLMRKPRINYECDDNSLSFEESFGKKRGRPIKKPNINKSSLDSEGNANKLGGGGDVAGVIQDNPGLVCNDISNGKENICIRAINSCNDPPLTPQGFTYIKCVQVGENVSIPQDAPGCNCIGKCTDPKTCSCGKLNGSEFPYVSHFGGRLTKPRDVVYECGPSCGCGSKCINRVSQHGIKYKLEVYKTLEKGWAVRSRNLIPSGTPVCEHVGILRRNKDLNNVSQNEYILDIDCMETIKGIEGRKRRECDSPILSDAIENDSDVLVSSSEKQPDDPKSISSSDDDNNLDGKTSDKEPEFSIDAASFGNVARFINHSCQPNLFVQCVLSSHREMGLARVVLFASEDISPMKELTYDYGYVLDSVVGPDGQVKQKPCFCGAANCRKRLY